MKIKLIFSSIVLALILLFNIYLRGFIWLLSFLIIIWFYLIIAYLIYSLWKKIRKKELMAFEKFAENFLFSLSVIFFLTFWIIWSFVFVINEFFPAKMTEYTLSNWEKTIKFQEMVHIWKEDFYNNIINNLISYKEDWWVYFYEWVRPGSEESQEKFNQALNIKFDNSLYENISKLYWVTFQDNSKFFYLVNDLDFNFDLSMDEIVELYDQKNLTWPTESKLGDSVYDVWAEAIKTLSKLNDRELKVINYVTKSMLNFLMKNTSILNWLTNSYSNENLFKVILDERNKVLVDAIIESEFNKIYITYWALHFDWVYELLKATDSNWKIIEENFYYPFK